MGKAYVTNSDASYKVYRAIEAGTITYTTHILETGERLDYLSGLYYKDSSFWWVIAAASGIGYALQVPPRTVLRIPQNITGSATDASQGGRPSQEESNNLEDTTNE